MAPRSLVAPLTQSALKQLEDRSAPDEAHRFRAVRVAVTQALEPLVRVPRLSEAEVTAASTRYLRAIDPITSGSLGNLGEIVETVIADQADVGDQLGDERSAVRFSRTLDALIAHEESGQMQEIELREFINPAVLCAGATVALESGNLVRGREMVDLADWLVSREELRPVTSGASVAPLDSELAPFHPPPGIVRALRYSSPALFQRAELPFQRGVAISESQAAVALAQLAQRAVLNLLSRPGAARVDARELSSSLRQTLGVSTGLASDYAKQIVLRLAASPAAAAQLETLRRSRVEAEANLFA